MNEKSDNRDSRHSSGETVPDKHTTDAVRTQKMFFGNLEVDRLNVQTLMAVTMVLVIGLIVTLLLYKDNRPFSEDIYAGNATVFEVSSGEEMISLLKENDLWERADDSWAVSPLLFSSYPDNIDEFAISVKKRVFFHGLLPVALTALNEVSREKRRLQLILSKIPGGYRKVVFSDDYAVWGRFLSADEIAFIMKLKRKYRTGLATEMVKRVDLVPLSMILAQGAIESSWATSRFAKEGNNLFGIWTWGEQGMIPGDRADDESHKVAMYDSILDSVRAYILTLNRLPAYRSFREIRKTSMNPLKLAEGLLNYSERRDIYVWEVKDFIQQNKLRQYDKCFLVDKPIEYKEIKFLKFTMREKNHVV